MADINTTADLGPLVPNTTEELRSAGITVLQALEREEAERVLVMLGIPQSLRAIEEREQAEAVAQASRDMFGTAKPHWMSRGTVVAR